MRCSHGHPVGEESRGEVDEHEEELMAEDGWISRMALENNKIHGIFGERIKR